jgi:hypothetical protein
MVEVRDGIIMRPAIMEELVKILRARERFRREQGR